MCYIGNVDLIPSLFSTSVFGYVNLVDRCVTMMSSIVADMDYPLPIEVILATSIFAALVSLTLVEKHRLPNL